jgi:hypothetical protein
MEERILKRPRLTYNDTNDNKSTDNSPSFESVWQKHRNYEDVFILICQFLQMRDFMSIRRTCKYWSSVTYERLAWKFLTLCIGSTEIKYIVDKPEEMIHVQKSCGTLVRAMEITNWLCIHRISYLAKFTSLFTNIDHLTTIIYIENKDEFIEIDNCIPDNLVVLNLHTNIKVAYPMDFDNANDNKYIKKLPNLDLLVLYIDHNKGIDPIIEIAFFYTLYTSPKLTRLCLENMEIDEPVLDCIVTFCTELQKLQLTYYPNTNKLDSYLAKLTNLTSLSILNTFNPNVDDSLLTLLKITTERDLENLYLCINEDVIYEDRHIEAMIKCDNIYFLQLNLKFVIEKNILALVSAIQRMNDLRALQIDCNTEYVTHILLLALSASDIKELVLTGPCVQWKMICECIFNAVNNFQLFLEHFKVYNTLENITEEEKPIFPKFNDKIRSFSFSWSDVSDKDLKTFI